MRDLDQALTDISAIREQLARGSEFRGYGPATLALTGALALALASLQSYWLIEHALSTDAYLQQWILTAAASLLIVAIETITRSRRAHGALALPLLQSAVEQFLPAIVAGALLTLVVQRVAPQVVWMLPGLWQIIFSLGVFASCRVLPRPVFAVGVWYLVSGLTCLWAAGPLQPLSPWAMGIPFGIGQILVALSLRAQPRVARHDE